MANWNRTDSYIELHTSSAFSFLEGGSLPEDLVAQAVSVGLRTLALVDANGLYGAPRFYKAAKRADLRPLVGAEVTVERFSHKERSNGLGTGTATIKKNEEKSSRLTLLVASREGYRNLCRLLTAGAMGREKGKARVTWEQIETFAGGLQCLTGGEEGPLAEI